jgi:threonine/homoserine/homoserine lactone efflux protein
LIEFWQDPLLLLCGILGGFCSSAPLGVINLWVTDVTLRRQERSLPAFLAGVILMDVGYAAIAFWGYHAFLQEGLRGALLGILGGLFLVALGILSMRGREPGGASFGANAVGRSPWRDFPIGLFMVASNPAFLMFWVFVIKAVEDRLGHLISLDGEVFFLVGIVLGDLVWFALLIGLVRRGRSAFQPQLVMRIRFGIACAFIAFGAWAIYRSTSALTAWSPTNPYGSLRYF